MSPQMVFRLYSEVLWYPGRQLNIMNMLQGSSTGTTRTPPRPATSLFLTLRLSCDLQRLPFQPMSLRVEHLPLALEHLATDGLCGSRR